jgi:hypothetical protein
MSLAKEGVKYHLRMSKLPLLLISIYATAPDLRKWPLLLA